MATFHVKEFLGQMGHHLLRRADNVATWKPLVFFSFRRRLKSLSASWRRKYVCGTHQGNSPLWNIQQHGTSHCLSQDKKTRWETNRDGTVDDDLQPPFIFPSLARLYRIRIGQLHPPAYTQLDNFSHSESTHSLPHAQWNNKLVLGNNPAMKKQPTFYLWSRHPKLPPIIHLFVHIAQHIYNIIQSFTKESNNIAVATQSVSFTRPRIHTFSIMKRQWCKQSK